MGKLCCNNEIEEESSSNDAQAYNQDAVDLTYEEADLREYRKSEILCYSQISVLCLIVVVCIINLSLENGDQTAWTGLLATSLGILLPQPGFNKDAKYTIGRKMKKYLTHER